MASAVVLKKFVNLQYNGRVVCVRATPTDLIIQVEKGFRRPPAFDVKKVLLTNS